MNSTILPEKKEILRLETQKMSKLLGKNLSLKRLMGVWEIDFEGRASIET
jgi:hypothetical protein